MNTKLLNQMMKNSLIFCSNPIFHFNPLNSLDDKNLDNLDNPHLLDILHSKTIQFRCFFHDNKPFSFQPLLVMFYIYFISNFIFHFNLSSP